MYKLKLAILIVARYDSQRLPGKAMMDVGGRPLLGRVIDRCRLAASKSGVDIIVGTSDRPVDDPIAAFCQTENIKSFRGAGADLAGRCLACAEAFECDAIVRISGDSPFIDPGLLGDMIEKYKASPCDLLTNVFPRSYPPGMSVEVMATEALRKICQMTSDAEDREHVTRFVYQNPQHFNICNVLSAAPVQSSTRLVVDTPEDLARAIHIADFFSHRQDIPPISEICACAVNWDKQTGIGT